MKHFLKRIAVILLTVVMLGVGVSFMGIRAQGKNYKTGDVIEFGSYPQSDVTESLGPVLDKKGGEWKSYNYYVGSGQRYDGKMTASDYMRYKDVEYRGEKYRGVTFDRYRPYCTCYHSSKPYQEENGYLTGKVYWFKFEPVEWRLLDPSTGLVMCTSIIDSQAFQNYILHEKDDMDGYQAVYWGDPARTCYANNYAQSSIRRWLNDDFYNTAFSEKQKAGIETAELNNDCLGTTREPKYDAPSTNDKIFLLSFQEATNGDYGFGKPNSMLGKSRRLQGSDYAKCQGLRVHKDESDAAAANSDWWLRTPNYISGFAYAASYIDYISDHGVDVHQTNIGVCPAMKLSRLRSAVAVSADKNNKTESTLPLPAKLLLVVVSVVFVIAVMIAAAVLVIIIINRKKNKASDST